jgi:uncharacterized protein
MVTITAKGSRRLAQPLEVTFDQSPMVVGMIDTQADFRAFRAEREAELTEPYGWLTLCGFSWLPAEPSSITGLPGRWWADGAQTNAYLTAAAADGLTRNGEPVDGTSSLDVAEYGRVPWVDHGEVRIELLRRGGRLAIRIRAATSPDRDRFTHVPTFPYDPAWRLTGRFTQYPDQREVVVDTIRPDLQQIMHPLGEVTFHAGGVEHCLAVTKGKYGWGVEFRDPSNGDLTPEWRQLHFSPPAPDSDGEVLLDFNRTLNMWFAFTDHATCPAPIEGNVITVPVLAGEQRVSTAA